ncbi:unnamed protein product [Taenia asiatica]|uniref:Phospholipid-transporting ATPase n=1 Tax=Taenia asiatica TaxID=60517 RepID=A0A158R8Y3_TAEAS|nr:unnamed protein product [Taenia asiatica]
MTKCFKKLQIKLGIRRPPWPENREIPVGPISQAKFVSEPWSLKKLYGNNEISTSRYTWYGFVFQNLEEQAQRIANFYFLCIAIVQLFTDSPVSPVTSILPLAFVILLTMVKQGYEDVLRHRADREINSSPVQLVNSDGTLVTKKAFEISVGDIVLQRANDTFPCDLVLLSSSESNGECYVTTASLDGETNLKRFVAISATKNLDSPEVLAAQLEGKIICQQPVDDFYKFYGKITVCINGSESTEPLGPECLLLRGARLRDTDFIYGVAVYTGPDTKMSLNSKGKQTKYSQVERQLNTFLLVILGLLVLIAILYTILQFSLRPNSAWYVTLVRPTTWIVVQEFLGFLVLFNYIIPISLYVTIEFQKFFGSMFFGWDIQMYDEEIEEPALVNTSDILEELGQVEYLFSDKTGTLTENCMVFQRFSVSSGTYYARDNRLFPLVTQRVSSMADIHSPRTSGIGIKPTDMSEDAQILFLILALCHTVRVEREIEQVGWGAGDTSKPRSGLVAGKKMLKKPLKLITDIKARRAPPRRQASVMRRASAMQSAEDAISSLRRGRGVVKSNYDYQASSPDEKAFVESCRDFGIVYHGVDPSGFHVVTVFDQTGTRYRVLDVLGFDSDRKCMSVVLQAVQESGTNTTEFDRSQGVVILCKGAETSILPRCGRVENMPLPPVTSTKSTSDDLLSKGLFGSLENLQKYSLTPDFVMARVTDFASAGLRTLVMGARYCPPEEWIELKAALDAARGKLEGRDAALAEAYKAVECDLALVGCTGIEDKLQDGVPETLTALREAGIQVWILTGDKEETAVNISFSAGHFAPGLPTVRVTQQDSLRECIDAVNTQVERVQESQNLNPGYAFGLVIDGHSLNYALTAILKDQFLNLCQMASSVLCCRLTPIQKAEIVRMMKGSRKPSPVCCAIGDGANDVSMILEAHVGIGLFGKEGRQAVRASDYALGKFRFLKRALLFHGFHYYVRTANLVQYFFYKNLVFTLTQVLFGIFSLFSSQSIYANLYLLLYNITMTSIPIIFYGIFEQRLPEIALMNNAEIYKTISKNRLLWWRNFFTWLSFSVWHGLVIFFGTYFLAGEGVSNGGNGGNAIGVLEGFGSFMIDCVFITVNVKLMLVSYNFNLFLIISVVGTLVVNFAIFIFANYVKLPIGVPYALLGVWTRIGTGLGAFVSYLALFVLFALCFVPDLLYRLYVDRDARNYFQNVTKSSEVTTTDESSGSYNGAINGAYYGSLVSLWRPTYLKLTRQVDPSAAYLRRIQEEQVNRADRSHLPDYTGRSFNVFFTNTTNEVSTVIPEDDLYFIPRPTDSSEYHQISPQAFLQRSSRQRRLSDI